MYPIRALWIALTAGVAIVGGLTAEAPAFNPEGGPSHRTRQRYERRHHDGREHRYASRREHGRRQTSDPSEDRFFSSRRDRRVFGRRGVARLVARALRRRGHWQTRTEKVLVAPGCWEERTVPARYERRVDRFGRVRWVCVEPPQTRRVWVPARYEYRTRRVWVPHANRPRRPSCR